MSRLEISGYVQIVIGIIGIVLTILTAPTLLSAIGQIGSRGAMPVEFGGISGAIRIFSVLFVLFVLVLLVILGLAITLSTLLKALGAEHPFIASFTAVSSVVALAVTVTLGATGSSLWIPGFVGCLGLAFVSLAACRDDEKLEVVWTVAIIFTVIFLGTGAANRLVQ